MNPADIVERLREEDANPTGMRIMLEAADHIAALEAEHKTTFLDLSVGMLSAAVERDELQAKLSKAVEALRNACDLIDAMFINDPNEPVSDAGHTALDLWQEKASQLRATLKEIGGDNG